jgi:hypothetical protein
MSPEVILDLRQIAGHSSLAADGGEISTSRVADD